MRDWYDYGNLSVVPWGILLGLFVGAFVGFLVSVVLKVRLCGYFIYCAIFSSMN